MSLAVVITVGLKQAGTAHTSSATAALDDRQQLPNKLTITGKARYRFTVTGDLKKTAEGDATIDPPDTIDGRTATGRVFGKTDSYRFSGNILNFKVSGTATVYLNGQEVDPSTLGRDISGDDALAARKEAQSLLKELKNLDNTEYVDVDDTTITGIKETIELGNSSFTQQEWAEAKVYYDAAVKNTKSALVENYRAATATILDASASQLETLKEHGYSSSELYQLEDRIATERKKLDNVDDIATARERYKVAQEIQSEVDKLPAPWTAFLINTIVTAWPLLALGGGLLIVGIAATRYQGDREDPTPPEPPR